MRYLLLLCFFGFHIFPFFIIGYPYNSFHYAFIAATVLTFLLGWAASARPISAMSASSKYWRFHVPLAWLAVCFVLYLGLKYRDLASLFNSLALGDIQGAMLQKAIDRYAGAGDESALVQIATMAFFVLSAMVGVELSRKDSGWRTKSAVGACALFCLFLQGADLSRASLILALILGSLFYAFNRRDELFRLGWGWAVKMFGGVLIAAGAIFVFAQYGRVYQEADAWGIVGERTGNLFLGGHYAFMSWLDGPKFGGHVPGMGMFAFVFKLAGFQFAQGNFETIEIPYGSTNIFLWYRGAIEDLGVGFVLFPFLCGYSIMAFARANISRIGLTVAMFGIQLILYPFYSSLYFTVFALPFLAAVFLFPSYRDRRA